MSTHQSTATSTCNREKKETQAGDSSGKDAAKRERLVREWLATLLEEEDKKKLKNIAVETTPVPMEKKVPSTYVSEKNRVRKGKIKKDSKTNKMLQERKKPKFTENLCKHGEIIGGRFRVVNKFKQGGFGQIYKAVDCRTNDQVALKIEWITKSWDDMESHVLSKLQNKAHYATMYGAGTTDTYAYVAMQLLGSNLSDLRKRCNAKPQRLSVGASIRVTIQCLEALKTLHGIGFLHRDIKPSNFAVGGERKNENIVYILDFGLGRHFLDANGSVKPARKKAGFRGTVRYASVASHELKDLSRRDDLWSLFYSFYELLIGHLRWRNTNDKAEVGEMKRECTPEIMCHSLPKNVKKFVGLIRSLKFEDKPQYDEMSACLNSYLCEINVKPADLYDWQVKDCKDLHHWIRSRRSRTSYGR